MEKMIIWGAGMKGMSVAKKLRKDMIKYFIDSDPDKVGRYFCGYEIRAVEELYNEKEEALLVLTVQDEMVDRVVKKWMGRSIGIKELFELPEIVEMMDEDIYTKYQYDKFLSKFLIQEEIDNWYRSDYLDEMNKQLVSAMRMDDQKAIDDTLGSETTSEKYFDEYYAVRPGMRLAKRIIQVLGRKSRIIDFGCGHGELLLQLSRDGYKVWGVDGDINRVQSLLMQGIKVSVQNVEKVDYESGFFDVVICMECLEHVRNVVKVVEEISRVLVDNGIAIITVPYLKRCEDRTHVRLFDETKLASLFRNDFEIINMIKMPYVNWSYNDNLFLAAKKISTRK